MPKKKTTGPDTPSEQPTAPARRATGAGPRKRATVPRDTGTGGADAAPAVEPIDMAADMSVDAGSSDSPASRQPTYDEIAEAAYQRYLQRGGQDGQDFDDWVEAERSLRERR